MTPETEKRRAGRPRKLNPDDFSHHFDKSAERLLAVPENRGDEEDLLSTTQTALWLGMTAGWLERGRAKGFGPPFVVLAPKKIAYKRGDVRAWIASRTFSRVSEYRG